MLEIRNISLHFNSQQGRTIALENVSMSIAEHTFAVIVGPSGCGKSTLLRTAAGLLTPTTGEISLDSTPITGPSAERGMVFQSYTLFPWLTVLKNIQFGLRLRHVSTDEQERIGNSFIKQVGLQGFEHAYPDQLSGGMQQRVALARALANDPKILLMDEPFGALDSQTRMLMQALLLTIWEQSHKTVLFITHDIDEAIFLADHIYVMSARPGRILRQINITLPRPRRLDMLTNTQFIRYKDEILGDLIN